MESLFNLSSGPFWQGKGWNTPLTLVEAVIWSQQEILSRIQDGLGQQATLFAIDKSFKIAGCILQKEFVEFTFQVTLLTEHNRT